MKFLEGVAPINFDPVKHVYTTKTGRKLISVTQIIHEYTQPFDPTGEVIIRCAQKQGKTVEQLRKDWDYERDSACERGHILHNEAEYWIDNKKFDESGQYLDVIKQLSKIKFKGKLKSETILYSEELGIAGTLDVIDFYNESEADIWDLKQNKSLKKTSFFNRETRKFQMMQYPVQHLMDCNYIHYSLQLSIYQLMLESAGYWVNDKTLLYLTPKTRELKSVPTLSLRKEALSIIKHYHSQNF